MSKIILADKGKALMPIAYAEGAGDDYKNAALDLAHYLNLITDANFEIVEGFDGPGIRLMVDEKLEEEEFVIKTCDCCGGLKIAGGSVRGMFYGVFGFLEDVLGVGFYTHDVTKIPTIETLELENVDIDDKPALEFRQLDNPVHSFGDWRAHNRLNGPDHNHVTVRRDPLNQFGGLKGFAGDHDWFCHTFRRLVDPDIYFDEYPEYFSMVDGVRIKERTQLCLTNPEVQRIAIEKVRSVLRAHPEGRLISISQNDWYNPCECPECAKMDAENGSHAGTLVYFLNTIAEAIEEEFPQVVVDTLAYQYTRTPPKVVKPRHNVCIRLCSIECCFGHPLETCDRVTGSYGANKKTSKASFQEDLIGWGKICNRIYIWDYVTNFRHYWLPFPNFHVLGPNIQFFVKNGCVGVYEEGNYQSVSPDLWELRGWLMAKLLWNPWFDVKKGIRDFCDAVYGPAADEIVAYVELLERRVTDANIHFGIYEGPNVDYLDADTMVKAHELIDAAQAKCLNLSQRLYVEKVALTLEFVEVGKAVLRGEIDNKRIAAMMEKGRMLGISRISEGTPWTKAIRAMQQGLLYR